MQQEMSHEKPPSSSFAYEGERFEHTPSYNVHAQKLSVPIGSQAPTAGQRLALAIVSLSLIVFLIFGLITLAIATNVPTWAVIPILFIITLFSAVTIVINIAFNHRIWSR